MRSPRVLVTGSDPARYAARLEAAGARPVVVPTIAVRALEGDPLDAALRGLAERDWIVVTSPNGARAALDRLETVRVALPAGPRWAAVGPRTAAVLEARGVRVACVPGAALGAAIPDAMGDVAGRSVLLLRARAAGDDLPAILRDRGAEVDDVPAYETVVGPESSRAALAAALADGLDAIVFTSGSTVRGYLRLGGSPGAGVAACIGPSSARAARKAGFTAVAVADERSPEGIVRALGTEVDVPG